MNILPHKSWHVRTKANIAKVRKDQAKAAEEEAEKQRKVAVADYEARIDFLRKKSHGKPEPVDAVATSTVTSAESTTEKFALGQHVELFADYEDKFKKVKPMDEEKRLEQEKYEKQIGYLTYLGQDTNEALGTRNWYDVAPKWQDQMDEDGRQIEIGFKIKQKSDPMYGFLKKFPHTSSSSEPKDKKPFSLGKVSTEILFPSSIRSKVSKTESSDDERQKRHKSKKKKKRNRKEKEKKRRCSDDEKLEKDIKLENLKKLREKRLQREQAERDRAKQLLTAKYPALLPPEEKQRKPDLVEIKKQAPIVKQKYNSQFNPELAKQNYM